MAASVKQQPFWRQQEVIFTSLLSPADARAVQRAAEAGALHRLREGVYTPFPASDWPGVVARNRNMIIAAVFPGAVIGWRNAFLGGFPDEGVIFLSYPYNRVVELPGLKVVLVKGAGPQPGDLLWQDAKLHFSGEARALLENLAASRGNPPRSLGRDAVQKKLQTYLHQQGEAKLNALRDQARQLAPALGLEREAARLSDMATSLLATNSVAKRNRVHGLPHDRDRIELFTRFSEFLRANSVPVVPSVADQGDALTHFAFLESYFSNFIEGTKFAIDEAIEIAIDGKFPQARPKDAHDIIGVMAAAANPHMRAAPLPHGPAVLGYVKALHGAIMRNRPDVRPGEFKLNNNAAGNTAFVHTDLVQGTMVAASQILPSVAEGLSRALLSMFILAEVHPFDDGNGRLARLAMNAELSRCGLSRIIVPSLMREDYLACLRVLTREKDPAPFVKLMVGLQSWTASMRYEILRDLVRAIRNTNALEEDRTKYQLCTPHGLE